MNILGIETATEYMSASLLSRGRFHYRGTVSKSSHCELLAGFILELALEAGIMVREIDGIAVSLGPGSFTGLRIGISSAMGLSYGLGKNTAGVNTLMSLSLTGAQFGEIVCPIIDAKRKEVYTALYRIKSADSLPETILPPTAVPLDSLDKFLPDDYTIVFTGPGAEKFRSILENLKLKGMAFVPPDKAVPSANYIAAMGALMFEKKLDANPAALEPVYLRKSDAELAKDICRVKRR